MKGKFIILFIIIILALSSTSVAALIFWQGQNLPILNRVVTAPFIESTPSEVMSKMYGQIEILSTARYDLQSDIKLDVYDEIFNLDLRSVYEGDLIGKPIGKMTTDIELEIQNLNFITSVESRFTEDKIYYSIAEVPAIPFVDLEKIHNNWYEYMWPESFSFSDDFLGMNTPDGNDYVQNIVRLPDEYVGGKLSYHYLMLVDLQKVYANLDLGFIERLNIFNIENASLQQVEIWIGKQSFLPYKAVSDQKINGMGISSILLISEFNESVAIDRPENGITTDRFIEDLFGKTNILDLSVFGYLVGIDDNYIIDDPDLDNLYSVWEDIFGTNKNEADTDNDGFLDGDEIRNGYNPNGSGKFIR